MGAGEGTLVAADAVDRQPAEVVVGMLRGGAPRQRRRQGPLAAPADQHGTDDLLARIAAAVGDLVRDGGQRRGRHGARAGLGLRAAMVGAQRAGADRDADERQSEEEHTKRHRGILAPA